MGGTDAESGRECEIGEMVFLGDTADESACHIGVIDAFAQESVEDGAARVLRLQVILEVEGFEDIVGKANRKMRRIGVVGFGVSSLHFFLIGNDDIRIVFLVEEREAIGGAFGGSRFEIVEIIGLFLVVSDMLAHVCQNSLGKCLTFFGGDIGMDEILNGFIGADESNGGEMILPVLMESLLDISEVEFCIGVEALFGELLDDFPFDFEAFLSDVHEAIKTLEEILFILGKVADSREIDSDDAD